MKRSLSVLVMIALTSVVHGEAWKTMPGFTRDVGDGNVSMLLARKLTTPQKVEGTNSAARSQFLYVTSLCPDLGLPTGEQKFGIRFQRTVWFATVDYMQSIKIDDFQPDDPTSSWVGLVASERENQMARVILGECAKSAKQGSTHGTTPGGEGKTHRSSVKDEDSSESSMVDSILAWTERDKAKASAASKNDAGSVRDSGLRSQESILKVIRQNMAGIQYVYQKYVVNNPALGGKISLKFTIAPSGDIIVMSVAASNTGSRELDEEVADKARRMKFETIDKGNVTVTYAFILDAK